MAATMPPVNKAPPPTGKAPGEGDQALLAALDNARKRSVPKKPKPLPFSNLATSPFPVGMPKQAAFVEKAKAVLAETAKESKESEHDDGANDEANGDEDEMDFAYEMSDDEDASPADGAESGPPDAAAQHLTRSATTPNPVVIKRRRRNIPFGHLCASPISRDRYLSWDITLSG